MKSHSAKCATCNSSDIEHIFTQNDPDFRYDRSKSEILESNTHYYICKKCGSVSQVPPPSKKALDEYYNCTKTTNSDVELFKKYKKEIYQDRLEHIARFINLEGKRVLEIGSSNGEFLLLLKNETDCEIEGIELNVEASNIARKRGVKTHNCSFDSRIASALDRQHLILSTHTLEHVIDPRMFVQLASKLLFPGGYLYLEVPDNNGVPLNETLAWGDNISFQHIHHFSISGLIHLLQDNGFVLKNYQSNPSFRYPSHQVFAQYISAHEEGATAILESLEWQNRSIVDAAKKLENLVMRKPNHRLILWGAGTDLWKILNEYKGLHQLQAVAFLVDTSKSKIGKIFKSLHVHAPDEIGEIKKGDIFIVTPASKLLASDIANAIDSSYSGVEIVSLFD